MRITEIYLLPTYLAINGINHFVLFSSLVTKIKQELSSGHILPCRVVIIMVLNVIEVKNMENDSPRYLHLYI